MESERVGFFDELGRGWRILLAAVIGNALNAGTLGFYSLGVLGPSLHRAYGWGEGAIAGGLLAMTISTLLVGPMVGALSDRIGVRSLVLASPAALACVFALFGALPLSLPTYYALWALASALGSGSFPMTWSKLLSQNFSSNRGFALGISFVGAGLTGFLLKPALFWIIGHHTWQAGFLFLAALQSFSLVSAFLLVPTRGAERQTIAQGAVSQAGATLPDVVRSPRFWLLILVVTFAAVGVGGPLPNMESVLRGRGYFAAEAVGIAQLIGLAILAGRLAGGALLDRIWAPGVGAVVLVLGALGCFGLWLLPANGPMISVAVILIGCTSGIETDLVAYLVARYFGLARFGAVYGILYGLFAIGTGAGAILFGGLSDHTGSHHVALGAFGAILGLSAAAIIFMGPYRFGRDVRAA